jgi:hypothetical protein
LTSVKAELHAVLVIRYARRRAYIRGPRRGDATGVSHF